ncbi:MAG: glycosyltransferase [Acidimicrobiia bacterium]|nr:glycosyltransferase [Acidimicrobiia bacterium]
MAAVQPPDQRFRLLVFVVAYEAEATLKDVLDRIPMAILESFDVEVLVVDDASSDRTTAIGREYSGAHPEMPLTVLRNRYNQGYGGNQKVGYAYAALHGFDFVALIHGDGQYAPEELARLLEPLTADRADAVFGSRMLTKGGALRGGMPLYKYIGNRILTSTQNLLLRRELSEYHSGYRAYRVAALEQIHYRLNTNDFHFDTQIILQLMNNGSRIEEVPIPTYYGDEISRVNGIPYAWNVVKDTAANAFHRLGFWQQRRLNPAVRTGSPYRSKLGFISPHSMAVDSVRWGSKVLDLGGGPGDVAAALVQKGCDVTVVDLLAPEAPIPGVRSIIQDLNDEFQFDVTEYDTVLMLDVIEHLADPEDFMARLRAQFDHRPIQLILSTPNVAFVIQRLTLLLGQFNYGESGILDRTHTRLFTFRSIRHLLRDAGFRMQVVRGVPAPIPLVVGGWIGSVLTRINRSLITISRTLFSFQIFIVADSTPGVDFLVADAAPPDAR